jgi:hypothetical protein
MDHIVYLDAKAKEFDSLLSERKTMIIRGATGRKLPYGRVYKDDILYFINNNAEGVILAKAKVKNVFNSDKMNESESIQLVNSYQDKLQLTKQQFDRWAGKRYLVLIEVTAFEKVEPFQIDKSSYGNMDDWLPVEQIDKLRIKNK